MAEQTEVPLSFGLGEDHVSSEARLPEGRARRVVNWDLDSSGVATQRPLLSPVVQGADCHSLWRNPVNGRVYVVSDEALCLKTEAGLQPVEAADGTIARFPGGSRLYFLPRAGKVYVTSPNRHGVIREDGKLYPWGVPNPTTPVRDESASQVRYLTYVDSLGQESGAVRFDQGTPAYRAGYAHRLYWADENSTKYLLNGTGQELRTRALVQFPPGRFLEEFAGRVATVRGSKVYYSSALNYSLTDPRYNFLDAGGYIVAAAAVEDGIYVSTRDELLFFSGTDVGSTRRINIADEPVLPGGFCRVPVTALPEDVRARDGTKYAVAAVTANGLVYCMPSGWVVKANVNVRLPPGTEVRVDLVERSGYYQVVVTPLHIVSSVTSEAHDFPLNVEVDDD